MAWTPPASDIETTSWTPPNSDMEIQAPEMGGSPPVGYVASKIMGMAPWNVASSQFPKAAGAMAEMMGGAGVNPYVSAAVTTPIAMAPDLLAAATALPEASTPNTTLETLADKATKSASSRWFKAAGGTLPNAKELGADEALRLGRLARTGGYVTPLNSAETQGKLIGKGLQESGKRLEELRGLGDLYGQSPEAMKIVQAIQQDLGPKYGAGIRSGESGELQKAIQEVLKLEPVDRLTATEEMAPRMASGTIEHGVPSNEADQFNAMLHSEFPPKESYENFRKFQEDPNFVPEYDLHRPTTFNEVSKVATDINQHAKSQSKLLQPSGAMADAANVISKMNNESLLKALPPEKGAEYVQNLQKYGDLSKIDRMNDLKSAYEVGGSRNSIVNNIANRIYHLFGHQLSAQALDTISSVLKATPRIPTVNPAAGPAALAAFIDKVTTKNAQ